jgi:hypothetical protein
MARTGLFDVSGNECRPPLARRALRIDKLTEGWLGSQGWPGVHLVFFTSPQPPGDLARKDDVTGRGFFFKVMGYEPAQGGMAVAPFLVLADLQEVPPADNSTFQALLYFAGGTFLVLLIVIGVMLVRDRRRSSALQAELLLRKRARRAQRA